MEADDKAGEKTSHNQPTALAGQSRLIECPFEVRVDGAVYDRFYDVRDAVASARAIKKTRLSASIVVTDGRTGKLVIEVQA